MKQEYIVKSDRYGHNHKFVQISECIGLYSFESAEEWMPIRVIFEDNEKKNIKFIDPEGGPNIYKGWTNGEIIVEDIFQIGFAIGYRLKEV
jgi:hypothetical protein